MKNILLPALIAIFVFNSLSAQKLPAIQLGSAVDLEYDQMYILGHDNDMVYVFRTMIEKKNTVAYIDGYSQKTLSRVFSNPLNVPVVNAEEFNVHQTVSIDDGVRVYYSFYSKKDDMKRVAAINIGKDGKPMGNAQELMRIDAKSEYRSGDIKFYFNKDTRQMLIANIAVKNMQETSPKTRVAIFNSGLERLVDTVLLFAPESVHEFEINRMFLDESANAYFVFSMRTKALINDNSLYFGSLNHVTHKFSSREFPDQKYSGADFKNTVDLKYNSKRDVIISFQYSEPGLKYSVAHGFGIIKINGSTAAIESFGYIPFMLDYKGERFKSPDDTKMADTYLWSTRFDAEDNMYFSTVRSIFTDKPAIWLKTDASMKPVSQKFIPRKCDDFIPTLVMYHDNASYYLYNDLPSNMSANENEVEEIKSKSYKKGEVVPCVAVVSNDGTMTRKTLPFKANPTMGTLTGFYEIDSDSQEAYGFFWQYVENGKNSFRLYHVAFE